MCFPIYFWTTHAEACLLAVFSDFLTRVFCTRVAKSDTTSAFVSRNSATLYKYRFYFFVLSE